MTNFRHFALIRCWLDAPQLLGTLDPATADRVLSFSGATPQKLAHVKRANCGLNIAL